jgi:glycosyltransferase involved in cell wall biosynthesis
MTVAYNGIDVGGLDEKRHEITVKGSSGEGRTKVVGGVGRLARGKDWVSFLRVAGLLSKMRGDVRFEIVGGGPLRSPLEETARRLGLAGKVSWRGFRADALELISHFDVFLLTSIYETGPITLLEAFALRVPVAGFIPRGGTREILGFCTKPAGAFVEERSPELLARAVSELLDNPQQAAVKADEGYRVVREHFDMARIAVQVTRVYEEVLSDREDAQS